MSSLCAYDLDFDAALERLLQQGYVVIEGVLDANELATAQKAVQAIFDRERADPYDPCGAAPLPSDVQFGAYMAEHYDVSDEERERLVRRFQLFRHANHDTPWPVPLDQMNKGFFHFPTLFDNDLSQRIWNLPLKLDQCGRFLEDPILLKLTRAVLGPDCVLSDLSATSVGPHTAGGAWHVDAPLTQVSEPLPDLPITTQSAWMLDDFTPDNGATRVVPRSHLSRKKPAWGRDPLSGEVVLSAPAGSLAVWLSQTWHRSGPNQTDHPRRALLGYFCRSWVKPVTEYTRYMPAEIAGRYSPAARYLLGWSAYGPDRG